MTGQRRGRSKQDRYEQLLDTAAKVFAANGYAEATIQQIAAEMEMTGAAVYYYVKSKDELLYYIWKRAGARLQETLDEVMKLDISPAEKLELAFHRHLEMIITDKPIFEVLILQRSRLPKYGRDDLVADERRYVRTLTELLKEFPPGTLRGDNPHVLALGIIAMLNGALRWYSPSQRMNLADIAHLYYQVFTQGALVEPDATTGQAKRTKRRQSSSKG